MTFDLKKSSLYSKEVTTMATIKRGKRTEKKAKKVVVRKKKK